MKKITYLCLFLCTIFMSSEIMAQAGSTFTNSAMVSSLPYVAAGETTCGFGDNYTTADIACTGSYLNGDEKIYSFTPSANIADFNVELTNIGTTWSGVFITDDSTSSGNCIGNVGSSGTATKGVYSVSLVAGTTYYIMVSTWATPQCISAYDINMYSISCPAPSALGVSSVTTTSVNLDWTEIGSATTWDIEWDTAGFTATGVPTITGTTTNPHSLSGLAVGTSYEFYVRSSCSATDSSLWVGPFSFATACNALSIPFMEGFNSTSNTLNCWTIVNNNNDGDSWAINTNSTYVYEGDQSVTVYTDGNGGNNDDYLISPALTLTGNERLKFQYRARSSFEPNDYQVLVSTSGSDLADFTDTILVDTASNTSFAQHVIDLSSYTGVTNIAFHIPNGGLDGWYLYVDEFIVETIPSCTEPDTLMASNITTSGADLYWSEMGTATLWDLEIVASGATPTGTPTNVGLTSDSVTINTLSQATAYDYYVRADCGGSTSPWSGPLTFSTLCSDVSVFPYTENFDGALNNGVWNCWTVVNNDNDAYTWSQASTYISARSGANTAHGMGNADDYLITPQLTIGATAIRLKFYDIVESATRNNTYTVRVSTTGTNPADFTDSITTIDCTNESWVRHIVDLTAYTNQSIYVAFHQTFSGATNYGFGIDDFTAELIPTCPAPDTLMTANVAVNSADLTWTEMGSATNWQVEVDTLGFTLGTGSRNDVTSTSFVATSLIANTTYDFYVRAVCGSGDSSLWVGPMSFTTTPDTINSFPYSNDIEAGLGMYLGLRTNTESDAFVDAGAASTGAFGIHLTGNSANDFAGGSTSATETQAFVTNASHVSAIDMIVDATSLTSLSLKFDMKQTYSYGPNYSWGRVTVNGTQLGASVNPSTAAADPFITVNVDLTAYVGTVITLSIEHSGKYNTANGSGGNGDNAYIDNIELYQAVLASAVVDSDVTCFGGSDGGATVSAMNGTPTYNFLWSNGATTASISGVAAGTYTVTVTDAVGDSSFASVDIMDGAALALDLGNDTSLCLNAALTLDAGTFTSYLWDDGSTMQTRSTVNTAVGTTSYSVTVTAANSCTAVDTIDVMIMADPVVALGNDTSICDGSMLTLDAGSFDSYVWDDASTMQTRMVSSVLGATTYSVTVTNVAGCAGSDDIVVTGYAPVMVDLGNDTSVCDAVTLTLDAGTFTSYVWDDASTMQTRMTVSTVGVVDYSVVVTDANGCTGNDTVSVTGFVMPMVNLGNDTTVCDAVTLTLDAGTFTSYVWDDASTMQTRMTVSTLGAVDYSVEVTDANGCTANDTIVVTGDAPVMVNLGSDTALCNGADYTLDAGAGFASYMWNNGFNTQTLEVGSTTAGTSTYSVVVETGAGCTGTDEVIISVNSPVLVDLGPDTNIWQVGVTEITLDAGTGFASYLWSDNITTTQTYLVRESNSGTVYVVVEDANGCTGTDTVEVNFVVGVEEFSVSSLKMYPNPAVDEVTVELSNFGNVNNVDVTFMTVTGQVVMFERINVSGNTYTETFDVSALATGSYFVKFDANGETVVRQFVIK